MKKTDMKATELDLMDDILAQPDGNGPQLREGWEMPEAPSDEYKPRAHFIGDGTVDIHYATDQQVAVGEYGATIPWPFLDDNVAQPEDLEALGFEVV